MQARIVALALLLLIARTARADEVWLQTGDHYAGHVVSMLGGTLTVETAYGKLDLPWPEIVAVAVDGPITVTVGSAQPVTLDNIPPSPPGLLTLAADEVVPLAAVRELVRPRPTLTVDGGLNAGFLTSANSDVNSLRVDGDSMIRLGANRYTAAASLNRVEDHGVEKTENATASVKYDRFLTRHWYFDANTILTNDKFRDLDLRLAAGAGFGYQVVDIKRIRFKVDAGLGYVSERLHVGDDDRYTAAQESASLELFLIVKRVQLFHKHDGYFGLAGNDNLFVKTQNGIRLLLSGFVTTAQIDIDYAPARDREATDHTFALTFGYRF